MLAEKAERRRLDAVQPVAEIHLVQIQLEDLVLRELALEARTRRELPSACGGMSCRVRKLWRASCCVSVLPPCAARSAQIVHGGRQNADEVDAAVVVEALILDREDRVTRCGEMSRAASIRCSWKMVNAGWLFLSYSVSPVPSSRRRAAPKRSADRGTTS